LKETKDDREFHSDAYKATRLIHKKSNPKRILRSSRRSRPNPLSHNLESQQKYIKDSDHPDLKIDHEGQEREELKSQLPKRAQVAPKFEQGGNGNQPVKTHREMQLQKRAQRQNTKPHTKRQPADENESNLEDEAKRKLIIQEELALLKAKNKLPSRGGNSKRNIASRDTTAGKHNNLNIEMTRFQHPLAQNVMQKRLSGDKVIKLHNRLDELNPNKENYFEKRDEVKSHEDKLKQEASQFIKRLKKESRFMSDL